MKISLPSRRWMLVLLTMMGSARPHTESELCAQSRRYRKRSGMCDNIKHPDWGAVNTPYIRLLPPDSQQLREIRKVTLSGLLCNNVNEIRQIQESAFYTPNQRKSYKLISCDSLETKNFKAWSKLGNEYDIIIKEAMKNAQADISRRKQSEYLHWAGRGGADPKSPVGIAAAFSAPNRNALRLANASLFLEYLSNEIIATNKKYLRKRRRRQLFDVGDNIINSNDDDSDILQQVDLSDTLLPNLFKNDKQELECEGEIESCNPQYPYRTYSGTCNNLQNVDIGKGMTIFSRLLPAVYEDGISKPRQRSATGLPLPSARLVSFMSHHDVSDLHGRYSLMMMQFAQIVDHDLTFTPVHRGFFASIPDCRPCDSAVTIHPECMPIEVPNVDPYYPRVNYTSGKRFCLPFMRSLPGQRQLGPREQINQNSHFLDASHVYGDTPCLARKLRSFGGKLNVTYSSYGKDLLPNTASHPECKAASGFCFVAGDGRASEQPGLTALHTIYVREHNQIVDGLHRANPHWDDEQLYQQARRLLVAKHQHIVYNEFLPRILGRTMMEIYGLTSQSNNYYNEYSGDCDPSILNEFASAAFRIGHTLLRPILPRMSPDYEPLQPSVPLRQHFFNPDILYERNMIDELIRGMTSTPVENFDQYITKEITNHLFEDKHVPFSGMDLPALNVQRARDHGIRSYNHYRAMCNLKRAVLWEDFSRELPDDVIIRFQSIYPSVDDVDLFPAGVSERTLPGAMVGPTFACILGIQFKRLRQCDRFWYETGSPILKFTEEQLLDIKKTTLAKILCDNMDQPTTMQYSALDQPSQNNRRVPCQSLPSTNFNLWREKRGRQQSSGCQVVGRTMAIGDTFLPSPCTSCVCTPDGPRCASIRVTNCLKMLEEVGRDAAMKDNICYSQCSSYISPSPSIVEDASVFVDRIPSPSLTKSSAINIFTPLQPPEQYASFERMRNTQSSYSFRQFASFAIS